MNVQKLKRYVFALALSAGFVVAPGLSILSTVQAQDRRDQRRDERQDRRDQRQGRWGDRRDDREGAYGNNGEQQRGYRDGLNRGQEDARSRRSFNPNNSSHFKNGNAAYREGFRRGYLQGYPQRGGNRRW